MSVVIKSDEVYYKDSDLNRYVGLNGIAERSLVDQLHEIETKGAAVTEDIPASYDDMQKMIVMAYDGSKVYYPGQYVRYNDILYKCVVETSGDESWVPLHWLALGSINTSSALYTKSISSEVTDLYLGSLSTFNYLAGKLSKVNVTSNGVTFTWNNDFTECVANGTRGSTNYTGAAITGASTSFPVGMKPGKSYYAKCTSNNYDLCLVIYYYKNGDYYNGTAQICRSNVTTLFTVPDDATGAYIFVGISSPTLKTYDGAVVSNLSLTEVDFDRFEDKTQLKTNTMIYNMSTASSLIQSDLNNCQVNKIYYIGAPRLGIANLPYEDFQGQILSFHFREVANGMNGFMQHAISTSDYQGIYIRHYNGSWSSWRFIPYQQKEKKEYYVGPTRTYTGIVSLLKEIQNSTDDITIYVDAGEYDIFQEYIDNEIPKPNSDTPVTTSSVKDFNVTLPYGASLIGLGKVTFKWTPEPGDFSDAELDANASKIWGPLQILKGNNTIENINIICKNARYCVFDAPGYNYSNYQNNYINVSCSKLASDENFGGLATVLIATGNNSRLKFKSCVFEWKPDILTPGIVQAYYGGYNSTMMFEECVFKAEANRVRFRYTSYIASSTILPTEIIFTNCIIANIALGLGGSQYVPNAEVTAIKCNDPDIVISYQDNPYPPKVYD